MAEKYLVSCECGQQLPVGVHQAGAQLTCECGKPLAVPPLRKLRQLPRAEDEAVSPARVWSTRQSVIVGGCSLICGLLLWGAYLFSSEPLVPEFDASRYAESVEVQVDKGTPLEFWRHWRALEESLVDSGFEEMTSPQLEALKAYAAERILLRNVVLGMAGVVAVATLIAAVAWPRSRGHGS